MWSLKRNDISELIKQKETHRLKRMNLWLPEGWGEGIVRVFEVDMYPLLYLNG